MSHPIENQFTKCLEFIVLAITVGSSFWLTFFASGFVRIAPN